MTIEEYNLSSDKPLNDIEQGALGYSKFATIHTEKQVIYITSLIYELT